MAYPAELTAGFASAFAGRRASADKAPLRPTSSPTKRFPPRPAGSCLMVAQSKQRDGTPPTIPAPCWGALSPVRYLGGRQNQHWLVESDGEHFVLRRYAREPIESVEYELQVLRRLGQQGWPVPEPVREPTEHFGRIWCLFS